MSLIDTHTHLESFAKRGELPAILARARETGVEAMIAIGTSPGDWALYRGLAEEHAVDGFVRHTVGLHPCAVDAEWESAVAQMEACWEIAQASRLPAGLAAGGKPALPVALGECGLDRFHLPKDAAEAEKIFAWQRAAFDVQLAIAKKTLAMPISRSSCWVT